MKTDGYDYDAHISDSENEDIYSKLIRKESVAGIEKYSADGYGWH